MHVKDQLIELTEQVNSLERLYEMILSYVQDNFLLFWTIIIGVFSIIGIALYFLAKSMVQVGVKKGLDSLKNEIDMEFQAYIEKTESILFRTPEKYSLTLSEKFDRIDAAEYWMNNSNEVTVMFNVKVKDDETIDHGFDTIGCLPVGFRPVSYTAYGPGFMYEGQISQHVKMAIQKDGFIKVWTPNNLVDNSKLRSICGTMSFLAD